KLIAAVPQTLMHAVSGGVLSGISGGDFGRGFIGGILNNISASLAQGMSSVGNFGAVEQHLAYAGAAAVSAKLQGGNFWQSAGQALTVGLLNHGVSRLETIKKNIHNTFEAVDHYFNGNGEEVELGWNIKRKLLGSEQSKYLVHRLKNGRAVVLSYKTQADLTQDFDTFFVGRTPIEYFTTCTKSRCVTEFIAFRGDGFKDPLDIGQSIGDWLKIDINVEIPRGKPYDFAPWSYKIKYKNPGYSPGVYRYE
ncbi:MAG: hypothetical protein Q4F57_04140, partial [Weeksellaceae bacterium]|nr:hypothetical protein [Weeksellaceae bacterium]